MGWLAAAALVAAGCGGGNAKRPGPDHDARLLEIANQYLKFGRVDDEARWAPFLCRMPLPSRGRISSSEDEKTHGRKLYYVFAGDRSAYLRITAPQPVGQVLVKESWVPEPAPLKKNSISGFSYDPSLIEHDRPSGTLAPFSSGSYSPYAQDEKGNVYHARSKAGLFIMFKEAPSADNDEGWVYGTVGADGKTVTAAGRVASCMRCHTRAPHDRVFGFGK